MYDRGNKRSTQDFMNKMLKFSGHKGEDSAVMEKNWPGPARPVNNMSDADRKRINKSLGRS